MGEQKEMTAAEMAASENYPVNKGIGYPASSVQDGLKRLIAEGKVDDDGADAIYWLYSSRRRRASATTAAGRWLGSAARPCSTSSTLTTRLGMTRWSRPS